MPFCLTIVPAPATGWFPRTTPTSQQLSATVVVVTVIPEEEEAFPELKESGKPVCDAPLREIPAPQKKFPPGLREITMLFAPVDGATRP